MRRAQGALVLARRWMKTMVKVVPRGVALTYGASYVTFFSLAMAFLPDSYYSDTGTPGTAQKILINGLTGLIYASIPTMVYFVFWLRKHSKEYGTITNVPVRNLDEEAQRIEWLQASLRNDAEELLALRGVNVLEAAVRTDEFLYSLNRGKSRLRLRRG